jgi:hypothetical protein
MGDARGIDQQNNRKTKRWENEGVLTHDDR